MLAGLMQHACHHPCHPSTQGELSEGLRALETGVHLLEQEHEATAEAAGRLVTVRLEDCSPAAARGPGRAPGKLVIPGKLGIPAALGGGGASPSAAEGPAQPEGPLVRVKLTANQLAAEEGLFCGLLDGFVGRAQDVRSQLTERASITDQVRCDGGCGDVYSMT